MSNKSTTQPQQRSQLQLEAMHYYDEEISIGGSESRNLNIVKVDRLPSRNGSSGVGGSAAGAVGGSVRGRRGNRMLQSRERNALQNNSTDDDGLLQDIIDHDDEDDDDDDDSDLQQKLSSSQLQLMRRSATNQRPQTRPVSTRTLNLPTALDNNDTEPSDPDSDEGAAPTMSATAAVTKVGAAASSADAALNITPDSWEQLTVSEEVKELFPYILKYTPQTIETHYHLQPFVPEYVPAVGDVDAFLKVTIPPLLQPQRQQEANEHLRKMGLYFLDEPSGTQSEPSLLNMKLRSVLTGSSGLNARSASASLVPTAKSPKDIDKWINEVEQVHMAQSVYDAQPRKDIETLLADWPRSFAEAEAEVQDAYQRCLQDGISLTDYINLLCRRFGVESPSESQADHILNVQTLFALYLAANQAWE